MKYRLGFVSNSSSSSFVIYGFEIEESDIIKIMKHFNSEMFHQYEEQIKEAIADEDFMSECEWMLNKIDGVSFDSLFGGLALKHFYDWGETEFGVIKDSEYFNDNDCVNGFVSNEQRDKLNEIAKVLDKKVRTSSAIIAC